MEGSSEGNLNPDLNSTVHTVVWRNQNGTLWLQLDEKEKSRRVLHKRTRMGLRGFEIV